MYSYLPFFLKKEYLCKFYKNNIMTKTRIVLGILLTLNFGCYKADIDNNSSEIDLLTKEVSSLRSEISTLNNLLAQSDSRINALQLEIQGLKSEVSNLLSSLENLEGIVDSMNLEINELFEVVALMNLYIGEVKTSFESIVSLNQDSMDQISSLINNISLNIEVIGYVSSYLDAIKEYQNSSSLSTDKRLEETNSLILDLKSLMSEFIAVENMTRSNLKTSLLGDIFSRMILKEVSFFDWQEGAAPGAIDVDCNWVKIFTDNQELVGASIHPNSNTLLLGHHSPMQSGLDFSKNDNLKFFLNFLNSPKSILLVTDRSFSEYSSAVNAFQEIGHSVEVFRISKIGYTLEDAPLLKEEELNKFQALIFYDGSSTPAEDVIQSLKSFVENPIKKSIIMGLGWVWKVYRSQDPDAYYPLNYVLEDLGATFNDKIFNNNPLVINYYPDTYNLIDNCLVE